MNLSSSTWIYEALVLALVTLKHLNHFTLAFAQCLNLLVFSIRSGTAVNRTVIIVLFLSILVLSLLEILHSSLKNHSRLLLLLVNMSYRSVFSCRKHLRVMLRIDNWRPRSYQSYTIFLLLSISPFCKLFDCADSLLHFSLLRIPIHY